LDWSRSAMVIVKLMRTGTQLSRGIARYAGRQAVRSEWSGSCQARSIEADVKASGGRKGLAGRYERAKSDGRHSCRSAIDMPFEWIAMDIRRTGELQTTRKETEHGWAELEKTDRAPSRRVARLNP